MKPIAVATEATWSCLSESDLAWIAHVDERRLEIEKSRVSPHVAETMESPIYSLRSRFEYWEKLIHRMEHDWDSRGFYMIDEYINDLESRSEISEILEAAPFGTRDKLAKLLRHLDRRFIDCTVKDDGEAFHRSGHPELQHVLPWLFERRPVCLPWLRR